MFARSERSNSAFISSLCILQCLSHGVGCNLCIPTSQRRRSLRLAAPPSAALLTTLETLACRRRPSLEQLQASRASRLSTDHVQVLADRPPGVPRPGTCRLAVPDGLIDWRICCFAGLESCSWQASRRLSNPSHPSTIHLTNESSACRYPCRQRRGLTSFAPRRAAFAPAAPHRQPAQPDQLRLCLETLLYTPKWAESPRTQTIEPRTRGQRQSRGQLPAKAAFWPHWSRSALMPRTYNSILSPYPCRYVVNLVICSRIPTRPPPKLSKPCARAAQPRQPCVSAALGADASWSCASKDASCADWLYFVLQCTNVSSHVSFFTCLHKPNLQNGNSVIFTRDSSPIYTIIF